MSVCGVKFTTARAVAEEALAALYGKPLPGYSAAGRSRPAIPTAVEPVKAAL